MPGLRALPKLVVGLACGLAGPSWGADPARVERLVVEGTNEFRREMGLPELAPDRALERTARYFAGYMARTGRYSHEADGREPADRATAHGYAYCLVSENISYQWSSHDFTSEALAERYVEGWKKSPGHRRNMVEENAVHLAVAVARSETTGRYYAVQMFGRPRSASVEFRISNRTRDTVRYRLGEESFTLNPGAGRIHERCGPESVTLAGAARAVRPVNGDRLKVVRESGRFAIQPDR